jgi:hypothetical protein
MFFAFEVCLETRMEAKNLRAERTSLYRDFKYGLWG